MPRGDAKYMTRLTCGDRRIRIAQSASRRISDDLVRSRLFVDVDRP
jgi:hypothetical protein